MDKIDQRRLFKEKGIPQPRFEEVDATSLEQVRNVALKIGYPLVVKSPGLVSGQGVLLCRNEAELMDRLGIIRNLSGFDPARPGILVEEYIPHEQATEYALQGTVFDGAIRMGSISKKLVTIDEPSGKPGEECQFRESGHVFFPPDEDREDHRSLMAMVGDAFRKIGCRTGLFQVDAMLRPNLESVMIEFSPRDAGSRTANDLVSPYGSIGRNFLEIMSGFAPRASGSRHPVAGYLQKVDPHELPRLESLRAGLDLDIEILPGRTEGDQEHTRAQITSRSDDAGTIEQALRTVTADRGKLSRP